MDQNFISILAFFTVLIRIVGFLNLLPLFNLYMNKIYISLVSSLFIYTILLIFFSLIPNFLK